MNEMTKKNNLQYFFAVYYVLVKKLSFHFLRLIQSKNIINLNSIPFYHRCHH